MINFNDWTIIKEHNIETIINDFILFKIFLKLTMKYKSFINNDLINNLNYNNIDYDNIMYIINWDKTNEGYKYWLDLNLLWLDFYKSNKIYR
jgi:hypothetical protein